MNVLELLAAPARQTATLGETLHRPWPMPEGPWIQGQTWDDLLFVHWRLPESELRAIVPQALPLDTWEGAAWLGITPFRVTFRLRGTFPVPRLSTFLELNVRTYVTLDGKPGIYFFSLDAESAIAVEAARRVYKLPYFRARMSARPVGDWIEYESARRGGGSALAFRARYRPIGEVFQAVPGSLDHFLAERYCLYTVDGEGRVQRADIHHPPWPLQEAKAEIEENSMAPRGVALPEEAPLLRFARRQDVVIWPLADV